MANRNELYSRQMIWAQYRSGSSKDQAYTNLKSDTISEETIDSFYHRFQSGNISLFDENSPHHDISQAIQTLPNGDEKNIADSVLFLFDDDRVLFPIFTMDGRFGIFLAESGNNKIILVDLFHGQTREVEIYPPANYKCIDLIKIIDNQHLLMNTSNGLMFLKVDWITWQVNVVSRHYLDFGPYTDLTIDQSDPCKALLKDSNRFATHGFDTVNLMNDQLAFSPRREYYIGSMHCTKLIGNQLCGLRFMGRNDDGTAMCQYHKIDLASLTEETIDVPITFKEGFRLQNWLFGYNFQGGKRFYATVSDENNRTYFFAFNTETLTWQDTGIVLYGSIMSYSIDQNEILTIQMFKNGKQPTFYRFALKKPDSLKNLAWLTIRRSAVLFNSNLYNRITPRLPYGRGLRCLFISDFE